MSGAAPRAAAPAARRSFVRRSFATLHFLPEPLLRFEVQIRENLAALRRQGFHAAKPPLELGVRRAQCRLRIHIELAGQIGGGEQQIADFFENFRRSACRRGAVRGAPCSAASRTSASSSATLSAVWPACSKSKPTRAARLLSLKARISAGSARGTPSKWLAERPRRRAALLRLDVLPGDALFGGQSAARSLPNTCGWRRTQLVAYRSGHRLEIELPRLARDLRVKHHLKQQIAQLVLQMRACRRVRWHPRLRRPLRWCTARCSRRIAPDPRGNRPRRAGAP